MILIKDTAIAEHLVFIFDYLGMNHYNVTSSLEKAKEKVRNKEVNSIVFDMVFCKKGYNSLIYYFCAPHICFIPIKRKWNHDEAIEAINAGMASILTYDCSKDKIDKCITTVEARQRFLSNGSILPQR